MITHPEGLDIPEIPTSQLALDAMLAIGELKNRGVILDVMVDTASTEQDPADLYSQWMQNVGIVLSVVRSRAGQIEKRSGA